MLIAIKIILKEHWCFVDILFKREMRKKEIASLSNADE
jgi:hypothetical protein